MEFDRVVQVRAALPDGGGVRFGSGYLVAPRLVLTAGHVLGPGGRSGQGEVTVCAPTAGGTRFPAKIIWHRNDPALDGALIEIDANCAWQPPPSLADVRTRPPQRWGALIGTRPQPVGIRGFPRMQRGPDGRLDEQLEGTIRPGTGALAGRYEVLSTDPTLAADPAPGAVKSSAATRWSGISGAALLCHDLLTGVIRRDRNATGGTRLTATRIQDLLADPGFHTLIHRHTGWLPLLEPVEPSRLLAPAARARDLRSPAMLLRADTEAVTFHGREQELQQLLDWCRADTEPFSVRVLTGAGGQGKTRLARHLAATARESGWVAGSLRPELADDPTGPGPDLTVLDTALPLLLVVDYAETLPHQVRRLIEYLRHSRHRTRVLLLARAEGDWKTDVLSAGPDTRALLAAAPTTELAPLLPRGAPADVRAAAFAAAVRDVAALLGQVPDLPRADWAALAASAPPPADLADARYDSALTLQMTALATLLQHGPRPVATEPGPGRPVEAVLLSHEERYWQGIAASPMFQLGALRPVALRRAVAAAVLCGAADQAEALATAHRIPGLPPGRAMDVAEWLRKLYPAAPGRYWGTLQPDRLAEFHASSTLADPGDATLTTLWTGASAAQQTQALTVLARAAIAHANAGRAAACTRTLATVEATLDAVPPHVVTLQASATALPRPSRIVAPLALRLTRDLTGALRSLTAANPDTYESSLTSALSNLAVRYTELGRYAEGLTAGEEATTLRRKLTTANPDTHAADLARTLSNLAVHYGLAGRYAEGLTAGEEATTLYRKLTTANPDTHAADLARTLSNLAVHYGLAGRYAEGLTAGEEATTLYRKLTTANPDTYEADLAGALNNLAGRYGAMGQRAKGLTAIEEAITIYRRLATANPDAHEPNLATSLSTTAWILIEGTEHLPLALEKGTEAIEIFGRLAEQLPAVYTDRLRAALTTQARVLDALGRPQEAEAVRQLLGDDAP